MRWFDERQVERWWLGFPIGVFRKYADDRGSALAALVTFHIFVGLLPLLAVVLGVVFWGDEPGVQLWIGGALVLGGVATIALRAMAKARPLPPPRDI